MKDKKKKIINSLIIIIILICLFNIGNSLYHIFVWKKEGDDINRQIEEIIKTTEINEVTSEEENSENIEIVEPEEKVPEYNPYWAYINTNLITVDFYDLKDINKDVAGWIQVKGTNINYPYVQTADNSYYLKHSFDKSYNSAGWVFLDYRNKNDLTDKNNILYAHGRYDKTMFGTLRDSLTNGWLNNKDNFVIKISTPYQNSLWQVFSIYRIPTTSDYLQINFSSDEQFTKFVDKLIKRSSYNFDTKVGANDKILTLSTCYNETEKVVLHAKLIKYEKR